MYALFQYKHDHLYSVYQEKHLLNLQVRDYRPENQHMM